MLTTPTYGFKKPELMDSPPDITITNPNWDVVEKNLKNHSDSIMVQDKQIDVLNENSVSRKNGDALGYSDGRSLSGDDLLPIYYTKNRKNGLCLQLFNNTQLGLPLSDGWSLYHVQTSLPWGDESSLVIQKASSKSNEFVRTSKDATTWNAWEDKIGILSYERGYFESKIIQDANLGILNGMYLCTNGVNFPTSGTWCLDVNVEKGGAIFQTSKCIYGTNQGKMFTRFYLSGWKPWQEVATTDKINISQSDLRNGWILNKVFTSTLTKIGDTVFVNISIESGNRGVNTTLLVLPDGFKTTTQYQPLNILTTFNKVGGCYTKWDGSIESLGEAPIPNDAGAIFITGSYKLG